jgi:hypothetical protein
MGYVLAGARSSIGSAFAISTALLTPSPVDPPRQSHEIPPPHPGSPPRSWHLPPRPLRSIPRRPFRVCSRGVASPRNLHSSPPIRANRSPTRQRSRSSSPRRITRRRRGPTSRRDLDSSAARSSSRWIPTARSSAAKSLIPRTKRARSVPSARSRSAICRSVRREEMASVQ